MKTKTQEFEKSIYPNLDAELMKQRITWEELANRIEMPSHLLKCRMVGIYDFTVHEGQQIKKAIKSDLLLEDLFKMEVRHGDSHS